MDRVNALLNHLKAIEKTSGTLGGDDSLSVSHTSTATAEAISEADEAFLLDTDGGRNQPTHWNGWGYNVS